MQQFVQHICRTCIGLAMQFPDMYPQDLSKQVKKQQGYRTPIRCIIPTCHNYRRRRTEVTKTRRLMRTPLRRFFRSDAVLSKMALDPPTSSALVKPKKRAGPRCGVDIAAAANGNGGGSGDEEVDEPPIADEEVDEPPIADEDIEACDAGGADETSDAVGSRAARRGFEEVVVARKDGDANGSNIAREAKGGNEAGGSTEAALDVQAGEADDESANSESDSDASEDSIEDSIEAKSEGGGDSNSWSAVDDESDADAEGGDSEGSIYEDTSLNTSELEIPHRFFRKRLAKTDPVKVWTDLEDPENSRTIYIYPEDLDSLLSDASLTQTALDYVICRYMTHEKAVVRSLPTDAYVMMEKAQFSREKRTRRRLGKELGELVDWSACSFILLPVSGRNHWSFLVIENPMRVGRMKVYHVNSMKKAHSSS
jgi:hypothetical protein